MEHTITSQRHIGDRPRPAVNYLNASKGIWSWMSTVDHKRIGVMYLVAVTSAFFLGGMFALLIRLTLLTPSHKLFGKVLIDDGCFEEVSAEEHAAQPRTPAQEADEAEAAEVAENVAARRTSKTTKK